VDGIVYVGSEDETLYAVDAETGEQEWAFTEPSNMVTAPTLADVLGGYGSTASRIPSNTVTLPTVVDGIVFVGSEDETLYAVDAETGEQE